jgi:hypothetical protein
MATKQRTGFLESQEGKDIRAMLQRMTTDQTYNTASSYSANTVLYPDSQIPFIDKHMNYLSTHPKLEPGKYIANLKIMSRVRR